MGIEKVIKLVIKIFTWFYQKWIRKIKIKLDLESVRNTSGPLEVSYSTNQ